MPNEFGTKYSTSCNLYEQILVNNVGLDAKILNVCLITNMFGTDMWIVVFDDLYTGNYVYIYIYKSGSCRQFDLNTTMTQIS